MDLKNLFYLLLSRYITYIGVFIASIVIIGKDLNAVAIFSTLFVLILLNSFLRIRKFCDTPHLFMISVLIEIPIILYMQFRFNSIAFVYFFIIAVDVYLMLKLKYALYMSIPILIGIILSLLPFNGTFDIKSFMVSFTINSAIMFFFSGSAYIIKMELQRKTEIQSLYDELKKSRDELEEANMKLTEYTCMVEKVSVLNERNRLAGEIHDTIGHSLTALIMEIDICSKLIDKDTNKTKEELKKASELARNTMAEVRRSVRSIKPSDGTGLVGIKAIEELIRDFQRNTGIIVKLNVSKYRYKLSPVVEVIIYRAIQEALTNCARHGHADTAAVDIDFKETAVELNIKDNGRDTVEFTKGVGLMTMEERIQSVGGKIDFSVSEGFRINAVIPMEVV